MEVLKLIAQAIFVKEAAKVGSKFLNNKRITKTDEQSFGLAAIAHVLVHLPSDPQNDQLNS